MSKLVTVFGSPGSGKTTLALALASRLAQEKQNVILLSSDRIVPQLSVLLPRAELNKSHSMGSLLLLPELTQKEIVPKLQFHPDSSYFACLALAPGDNPITYPALFDPKKITALLNILAGLADWVIVDGTPNPAADSITLTALEVCDRTVCTLTPDRRGIQYLSGILAVLRDEKYRTGKHLRILSPVREVSPVKQVREQVEDIRFTLPYSAEIEEMTLAGKLIGRCGRREGMLYEQRSAQILEELKAW